jgi:DnaJ-class molecular chaperone
MTDPTNKICPNCKGNKTVLTEKDRLGLRYIVDCVTCRSTGEVPNTSRSMKRRIAVQKSDPEPCDTCCGYGKYCSDCHGAGEKNG